MATQEPPAASANLLRMKRTALLCFLALLCLSAGFGQKRLTIGGVSPGLTAAELMTLKGQPEKIERDLLTYKGQLKVRLRDDRVVFVGGMDLETGGNSARLFGVSSDYLKRQLGEPFKIYTKGAVQTWVYASDNADVGIMLLDNVVGGFILQEMGSLPGTLETAGYR